MGRTISMSWLNVIANAGVLIGLLSVLFQMRQDQELLRVTLTNDFYTSYIAADTAFAGENLPAVWERALLDPKNLSIAEMRVMEAQTFAPINRWINLYRLSEAGIVDESFWKSQVNLDASYYLGTPYGKAYWEVSSGVWPDEFLPNSLREHIDQVLSTVKPETTLNYYKNIKAAIR
jgi:hypothetical protein